MPVIGKPARHYLVHNGAVLLASSIAARTRKGLISMPSPVASASGRLADFGRFVGAQGPPDQLERDPEQPGARIEQDGHKQGNSKCWQKNLGHRCLSPGGDEPADNHDEQQAERENGVQTDAADKRANLAF